MKVQLLTWAPDYGLQIDDSDETPDHSSPPVDITFEQNEWTPIEPAIGMPAAVQIIDGVRRMEASAVAVGDSGERLSALFGSLAVGAVTCLQAGTRVLHEWTVVQRRYVQAGGDPRNTRIECGGELLTFEAQMAESAANNGLLGALQAAMRHEESKLAERLSAISDALTFVDGPLHLRSPGRNVLGYIKRVGNWYLAGEQQLLLPALHVGQRTPLFRIPEAPGSRARTSWFVRVADPGLGYDQAAGVMRVEAPEELPRHEAIVLADQSARVLPILASSPVRDPRAPQNLTPVGALESQLTHRMGDRRLIRRALAAWAASTDVAA